MNHPDVLATLSTTTGWHKSSRSAAQNSCLEVTTDVTGWIGLRDTKLGSRSPILAFPTVEWNAILAATKNDRFAPTIRAPGQRCNAATRAGLLPVLLQWRFSSSSAVTSILPALACCLA
ncbi:MAG: DUF397 domain-containing protein [Pseudonocardiaceae bacterium]